MGACDFLRHLKTVPGDPGWYQMRAHISLGDIIWQRSLTLTLVNWLNVHSFALKLLPQGLLPSHIPIISRSQILATSVLDFASFDLLAVIKKPLDTLHIELELPIAELVKIWDSKWQIQFLDGILKYFEISMVLVLVPRLIIQFVQLNDLGFAWEEIV